MEINSGSEKEAPSPEDVLLDGIIAVAHRDDLEEEPYFRMIGQATDLLSHQARGVRIKAMTALHLLVDPTGNGTMMAFSRDVQELIARQLLRALNNQMPKDFVIEGLNLLDEYMVNIDVETDNMFPDCIKKLVALTRHPSETVKNKIVDIFNGLCMGADEEYGYNWQGINIAGLLAVRKTDTETTRQCIGKITDMLDANPAMDFANDSDLESSSPPDVLLDGIIAVADQEDIDEESYFRMVRQAGSLLNNSIKRVRVKAMTALHLLICPDENGMMLFPEDLQNRIALQLLEALNNKMPEGFVIEGLNLLKEYIVNIKFDTEENMFPDCLKKLMQLVRHPSEKVKNKIVDMFKDMCKSVGDEDSYAMEDLFVLSLLEASNEDTDETLMCIYNIVEALSAAHDADIIQDPDARVFFYRLFNKMKFGHANRNVRSAMARAFVQSMWHYTPSSYDLEFVINGLIESIADEKYVDRQTATESLTAFFNGLYEIGLDRSQEQRYILRLTEYLSHEDEQVRDSASAVLLAFGSRSEKAQRSVTVALEIKHLVQAAETNRLVRAAQ